jgi:hypothetical protein
MSDSTKTLQIKDIIEYPRKSYSPDQPCYESDVYDIPSVQRENRNNGNPGKTGLEQVNINFAARKNIRKE